MHAGHLVTENDRRFLPEVAVDDVDAIAQAIETHGGKIVLPKMVIEGVGRLIQFEDTEGNLVGAMHYDEPSAS